MILLVLLSKVIIHSVLFVHVTRSLNTVVTLTFLSNLKLSHYLQLVIICICKISTVFFSVIILTNNNVLFFFSVQKHYYFNVVFVCAMCVQKRKSMQRNSITEATPEKRRLVILTILVCLESWWNVEAFALKCHIAVKLILNIFLLEIAN